MNLDIDTTKLTKTLKWLNNNKTMELFTFVFEEKRKQFFKFKLQYDNVVEVDILAFITSLEVIYDEQQILNKKNKSMNLKSLKRASIISKSQFKKQIVQEKWDFLLNHRQAILSMNFDEELSSRQIAIQLVKRKYIKKNTFKYSRSQNISHMYIHKFLTYLKAQNV